MFQFIRKAVKSVATKVLRFAVTRNWVFLARLSVFLGANVNHTDTLTGNTLLHLCKSQNMCDFLLIKNANIDAKNLNNETALQTLVDKNINLLWVAIYKEDLKFMRSLLEKGADPDYKLSPVYKLSDGINKSLAPIFVAVLLRKSDMVELLLEYNANADLNHAKFGHYEAGNLLSLALQNRDLLTFKLLLNKSDINFAQKQKALCWIADHWAAEHYKNEMAKILLEKGADVNHIMTEGTCKNRTPLWIAVSHYNLDLARFFIDNGANINFVNNQGKTILMTEAVKNRGTAIIEFLLKNGATVDLKQQAWQDTLANTNDPNCATLIKNAQETKPILTMLELQMRANKQKNLNAPLKMLPLDGCFKPLKEMLTGHKVTRPKATLN